MSGVTRDGTAESVPQDHFSGARTGIEKKFGFPVQLAIGRIGDRTRWMPSRLKLINKNNCYTVVLSFKIFIL